MACWCAVGARRRSLGGFFSPNCQCVFLLPTPNSHTTTVIAMKLPRLGWYAVRLARVVVLLLAAFCCGLASDRLIRGGFMPSAVALTSFPIQQSFFSHSHSESCSRTPSLAYNKIPAISFTSNSNHSRGKKNPARSSRHQKSHLQVPGAWLAHRCHGVWGARLMKGGGCWGSSATLQELRPSIWPSSKDNQPAAFSRSTRKALPHCFGPGVTLDALLPTSSARRCRALQLGSMAFSSLDRFFDTGVTVLDPLPQLEKRGTVAAAFLLTLAGSSSHVPCCSAQAFSDNCQTALDLAVSKLGIAEPGHPSCRPIFRVNQPPENNDVGGCHEL